MLVSPGLLAGRKRTLVAAANLQHLREWQDRKTYGDAEVILPQRRKAVESIRQWNGLLRAGGSRAWADSASTARRASADVNRFAETCVILFPALVLGTD